MNNIKFEKKVHLIFIIFVAFIAKIILLFVLPDKYTFDNSKILNIVLGNDVLSDPSFDFVANIYRFFNIFFHFDNIIQWSILLGIIGNVILMYFAIKKYDFKNFFVTVLFYILVFFLNIYAFNISKDFIQFIIFFFVYLIYSSKLKNLLKYIFYILIFVIESLVFREYYVLLIPFIIVSFFLERKNYGFVKTFLIFLLTFMIVVYVAKVFMPSDYNKLVNIRNSTNINRLDSENANTIITDKIIVSNYFTYILSYFINLTRILFPFELIFDGFYYFAFFVFQVLLDIVLFISFRVKKVNIMSYFVLSYLFVTATFEPDFGSFIRHESSLFPIFVILFSYFEYESTRNKIIISNSIYDSFY